MSLCSLVEQPYAGRLLTAHSSYRQRLYRHAATDQRSTDRLTDSVYRQRGYRQRLQTAATDSISYRQQGLQDSSATRGVVL
ncbi:unnamed protein product [Gadus morhua 'NCC']